MKPLVLFVALAGCFSPKYGSGHLKCAAGKKCPSDFHCAADNTCWKDGSDPVLDLSAVLGDGGTDLLASDGPLTHPDGFIAHKGDPCLPGDTCDTGHCIDGYCCESSCTGACQACNVPGFAGLCTNVPAGADPVGTRKCGAQAASTCNLDGKCDGAGACRNWPAGTVCVAGTCAVVAGGGKAAGDFVDPSTCDGLGNCVANGSGNCAPYVCLDATRCYSSCSGTSNVECSGSNKCVGGSCGKLPNGRQCTSGTTCLSGNCTDGYCCSDPCASPCQACNVSGAFGTCTTVLKNTTPKAPGCPSTNVSCSGFCDGLAAGCSYPGAAKVCGNGCSAKQFVGSACDGAGNCSPLAPSPCPAHFACEGSSCVGSCTGAGASTSDCVTGYGCSPITNLCMKICVWGSATGSDTWDDGCICG